MCKNFLNYRDPNHSLVVVNNDEKEEIVDAATRREKRRKIVEDIKKQRKELGLNKIVVKTIKFSLYVLVLLMLIIMLRSFLRYMSLLPEAKEIKVEIHNPAEVEMLIKNNINKYN